MRPSLGLSSVGEQVHDDGTLGDGLIDLEQVLAGDPAVLDSLLPGSTILADTDDDVHAVVTEVEALAVTLGTVADEGEGVVLEVFLLCLYQYRVPWKRFRCWNIEFGGSYMELLARPVGTLCRKVLSALVRPRKEDVSTRARIDPMSSELNI